MPDLLSPDRESKQNPLDKQELLALVHLLNGSPICTAGGAARVSNQPSRGFDRLGREGCQGMRV